MQACHSRECATRLCCNGDHLRWDTNAGNQADVTAAGTRHGEKNPNAKLTASQVERLRYRKAHGEDFRALAAEFGVAPNYVHRVCRGGTWTRLALVGGAS